MTLFSYSQWIPSLNRIIPSTMVLFSGLLIVFLSHSHYPPSSPYFKVFLQPSALLKPPCWNDSSCQWLPWICSGMFPAGRNRWMVKRTFHISWILFTENITILDKRERGKSSPDSPGGVWFPPWKHCCQAQIPRSWVKAEGLWGQNNAQNSRLEPGGGKRK